MHGTMVSYLLGELPIDEQVKLEERYTTNEFEFESLLATENDLIDAYVRNELSTSQRLRFEKFFLISPKRRQRLAFAQALATYTSHHPMAKTISAQAAGVRSTLELAYGWVRTQVPALRLAAAAAAVLILASTGIWIMTHRNPAPDSVAVVNESTAKSVEPTKAPNPEPSPSLPAVVAKDQKGKETTSKEPNKSFTNQPKKPAGRMAPVAFVLTPEAVRGVESESNKLVIPKDNPNIQLKLELEDGEEYKAFNVEIDTVEGTKILDQKNIKVTKSRTSRLVIVDVKSQLLPTNDYIIKLAGINAKGEAEDFTSYSFSISQSAN